MNKIISMLLITVLCSCSSEPVKTTNLPKQSSNTTVFTDNLDSKSLVNDSDELNVSGLPGLFPSFFRYIKQGIASWYGPRFHGKKTASGEIYDMYAMTAAHKTLPISSYARVTNLENKRSVIVRINDRGPFHGNRVMDLSYAAAKKLDIQQQGSGTVEIKTIPPQQVLPQLQKSAKAQGKSVYLQVGTFGNKTKALKLKNKIAANHLPQPKILSSTHKGSTLYKVQLGPIQSPAGARKLNNQLAQLGITAAQFVTEHNQKPITMVQ